MAIKYRIPFIILIGWSVDDYAYNGVSTRCKRESIFVCVFILQIFHAYFIDTQLN